MKDLLVTLKIKQQTNMEKSRNPFKGTYAAYYKLVESGKEQAQTTHGDRYEENNLIAFRLM
jgi:hypothetical protein